MSEPTMDTPAEPAWRVTPAILALIRRLPGYYRLAWALLRDPRVPAGARRWLVGAGIYNLSPVDLVPGIIPVLGQLDEYAILLLAIRKALRAAPEVARSEHLGRARCSEAQIEQDLREMRRIAGHVTRQTAWSVWAGLRFATGVGMELGRQLIVGAARAVRPAVNPAGGSPKEETIP